MSNGSQLTPDELNDILYFNIRKFVVSIWDDKLLDTFTEFLERIAGEEMDDPWIGAQSEDDAIKNYYNNAMFNMGITNFSPVIEFIRRCIMR